LPRKKIHNIKNREYTTKKYKAKREKERTPRKTIVFAFEFINLLNLLHNIMIFFLLAILMLIAIDTKFNSLDTISFLCTSLVRFNGIMK